MIDIRSESRAFRHIPELDGVRGIAILLVLFFHFQPAVIPSGVYYRLVGYGWSGVDLFFVLSGFLITRILLNTRQSPRYFSNFYIRRALRIFPLYFAFVLAFFHWMLPLMHGSGKLENVTCASEWWYLSYLFNWHEALGGQLIVHLSHLWSLAIEEQFYFVWPAMVYLLGRKKLRISCLVIIVASLALRVFLGVRGVHSELLHRLTICRMDTLAWGALVATLNAQKDAWSVRVCGKLRDFGIAALCGVVLVALVERRMSFPMMQTFGYSILSMSFSSLVLHCVQRTGQQNWICRAARSRFLTSFGQYSYAIYVLHIFVILKFKDSAYKYFSSAQVPSVLITLGVPAICIALSFLIGLGSWNILEKHFINLKERWTCQPGAFGKTTD